MKERLGKRGLAALAIGLIAVLAVVVGVVVGGDGSDNASNTTPEAGATDSPGEEEQPLPAEEPDTRPPRERGSGGRGGVPAPSFSAPVAKDGELPGRLNDLRPALEDGRLTLDDLEGTPAVITGLASWCAFCGPEARLLESEWGRWGRRGVLYLSLDVQEPAARAAGFADEFGLTFPVLSDSDGDIARSFKMKGVPETVFVSEDGEIVGRVIGGAQLGQLEVGSTAALDGRRVGTQRGGAQEPLR